METMTEPIDQTNLARFATRESVGRVDRKPGIIHGVSVATLGEAKGHDLYVDEVMLDQIVEEGKSQESLGVKSRFDHANPCTRSVGSFTGRFHDFRRDGDRTRADVHLSEASSRSPDGDLREYILSLAEEDPDAFGVSIVFRYGEAYVPDPADQGKPGQPPEADPYWLPHARVEKLHHIDVVDSPAANTGLFNRPDYMAEQAERWGRDNPSIIGKLFSQYQEWKEKQEVRKMDEKKFKEMETELSTAKASIVTLEAAAVTSKTTVDAFEGKLTEAKTAATTEADSAFVAKIKARVEQFDDPAFVIETIEMSDGEAKDAFIVKMKEGKIKLKKGKKKETGDGEKTGQFSDPDDPDTGGGDGDDATFEDKVQEKVDGGMSRGKAISACVGEFSKLHKEYLKRINAKRNPADDDDE